MTETIKKVFDCQACGQCCHGEGGIYIDRERSQKIADSLGLSRAEFEAKYTGLRHGRREIKTGSDGACLFLKDNRCAIHPVKPDICRQWPYLPGALTEEIGFTVIRDNCPGFDPEATWVDFKAEYARLQAKSGDSE